MPITLPFFLALAAGFVVIGVYSERKISAFIQDRMGPMEVGKWGLLQLVADLLKLIQKEDIVPAAADRRLFLAAPLVIFTAIFAGFAVLPLSPDLAGSTAAVGVFYLLTIISVDVVGILMAGWGSNNKYSLLGAMRSVAQIVSYEIPLGLSVLCVVMICQTLDLQIMSYQQGIYSPETNYLLGLKSLGIDVSDWGGFFAWNVFRNPFLFIVYVIFFIATLAECNRAPFDLPEGESELVGGFHTEYSGMRWALLFLSEYAIMLLVSFLGAILFWGSWNTPFPNIGSLRLADWTSGAPGTIWGNVTGFFWLFSKAFLAVLVQMWVRWTFPRLRIDQLMFLCWKVLTPLALILFFVCGVWRLLMV
ncbi:MAG: NADH-quinone oxidoreductase subunit H [Cytophagia bacterium]|nr:MAG: NADH-quinone oxidoreductase subunit H [Runella sp.]TAG23513.1 MAG: NADH-quinone oxidoreductase subunit H [Cytophagales bacterium]TAG42708.1 MAG: NADH-quinone oxidoreductase subunit H [Cytophagia bacterium]TAG54479.1 MAG: NADH-quinone oxidoreductase subunit H [Runella slithyformis]TAG76341.1 MAG: NADH-quinone oxidoreductase subunit H [Cytophagales bacterium]